MELVCVFGSSRDLMCGVCVRQQAGDEDLGPLWQVVTHKIT